MILLFFIESRIKFNIQFGTLQNHKTAYAKFNEVSNFTQKPSISNQETQVKQQNQGLLKTSITSLHEDKVYDHSHPKLRPFFLD